jgi:hypothetical protein
LGNIPSYLHPSLVVMLRSASVHDPQRAFEPNNIKTYLR